MALFCAISLTSCHQDAPELEYNHTVSVTVNNDFTALIEAINKNNLTLQDAIGQIADAIDAMSASQEEKLKMIVFSH